MACERRAHQALLGAVFAAAFAGCGGAHVPSTASPNPGPDAAGAGRALAADAGRDAVVDSAATESNAASATDGSFDALEISPNAVAIYSSVVAEIPTHLYFRPHSIKLERESEERLEGIARVMKRVIDIRLLEVRGHADVDEGKSARWLAEYRAKSVVERLVELGVDPERLQTKGYGASHPHAAGRSDEARRMNRCVSFRVVR